MSESIKTLQSMTDGDLNWMASDLLGESYGSFCSNLDDLSRLMGNELVTFTSDPDGARNGSGSIKVFDESKLRAAVIICIYIKQD